MVNSLIQAIKDLFSGIKPWVLVQPWEQAVRSRAGKRIKLLTPGIHIRIPLIDIVSVQSTRLRMSNLGKQTLSTKDGKTVTMSVCVSYSIVDLEKLYNTLHHAEDTIQSMARGLVCEYMSKCDLSSCEARLMKSHILSGINIEKYGIKVEDVNINDFAVVKTYRLIGDNLSYYSHGESLMTYDRPIY